MKPNKYPHPATMWPSNWLFHNRSDEEPTMQVVDILHDIRNILLVILIVLFF